MARSVSVLMSVYNGAQFLREAVDSILAQTHTDFDFVVIDDGSNDASAEILASYRDPRLKVFSIENRGLPAALNYGLERCSTDLVMRMDADDVAYPHRFAALLEDWEQAGCPDVFGSGADYINEVGDKLWGVAMPISDAEIRAAILDSNGKIALMHPTVLLRKESVLACGGYDPFFRNGQDFELWLRMTTRYRFGNSPRRLLKYRFQPNSDTAKYIRIGEKGVHLGNWVHLLALQKKQLSDAGKEAWWCANRDAIIGKLLGKVDLTALQIEAVKLRMMTDAKVLCYSGKLGAGLRKMLHLMSRDPLMPLKRLRGKGKTDLAQYLLTPEEMDRLLAEI